MEIVPVEIFGVAVDVPFPRPLAYGQARLEDFSAKLCDPVTGLSLRPSLLRLRRTDDLYDYELSGHFFGENGSLTRTADRVKLAIRNARNAADWNIVHQTFTRFYKLAEFAPESATTLSLHVHAKFSSAGEREGFLDQFNHHALMSRPAALGYVRIMDWEKDIRVLIEQSNAVPDGIFIAWDTQFAHPQEWDTFLGALPTVMENAVNVFGLGLEPFKKP